MGQAAMEAETVIRFDEESSEAIVYTASSRVAKWMDKEFERLRTFTDTKGNFTGAEYKVPKRGVRIATKGVNKKGQPCAGKSLYLGGR